MKTVLSIIFFFIIFIPSSGAQNIRLADPGFYMPDFLLPIRIGMSITEFEEMMDTQLMEFDDTYNHLYLSYTEESEYAVTLFKFAVSEEDFSDPPLYEISIHFEDIEEANEFVSQKFGKPNEPDGFAPEEWGFQTEEGIYLMIRKFESTVQIISIMKGTEWDPLK